MKSRRKFFQRVSVVVVVVATVVIFVVGVTNVIGIVITGGVTDVIGGITDVIGGIKVVRVTDVTCVVEVVGTGVTDVTRVIEVVWS